MCRVCAQLDIDPLLFLAVIVPSRPATISDVYERPPLLERTNSEALRMTSNRHIDLAKQSDRSDSTRPCTVPALSLYRPTP